MDKIVTLDIGNTNITAGIFSGAKLIAKAKMRTPDSASYAKGLKELLNSRGLSPRDIEGVIISSVVPHALSKLLTSVKKVFSAKVKVVGRNINVPIKNLYRKKRQVGKDRLVNAFAARVIYGAPCVIIDFGTAVTFDIVSQKGEYLGGLIMPGVGISLGSLYEKTALLPKVELKDAPHIIGKDTVSSMRGGILFGFGAMCDGLVSRYKKILGKNMRVILTGGNARLIAKYAHSIQIIDEDLTLKGLRLIY